jgi:hypothetical protein
MLFKTLVTLIFLCILTALTAAAEPLPGFGDVTAEGAYPFDTGVLRGELAGGPLGLLPMVYVPTETPLAKTPGIYNFYRVFSTNHRYVESMRATPCTSERVNPQTLRVHWDAGEEHPFTLEATYMWVAADTLDVVTEVTAVQALPDFEVFLASYCAEAFKVSSVFVVQEDGDAAFMTAEKIGQVWQAFPRDDAAVSIIQDGRWAIQPSPVDWAIRPKFAAPLVYRRDPESNVAVVTMALAEDCFAVLTPERDEAHYSMYFSLFGRDVAAGETVRARTRLVVGAFDDAEIIDRYNAFLDEPK